MTFFSNSYLRVETDGKWKTYFYDLTTNEWGATYINQNQVVGTSIKPSSILSIGKIVAEFANPDLIYLKEESSEALCYDIRIFYLDKGIYALSGGCVGFDKYYKVRGGQMQVDPNMPVYLVEFFEPSSDLSTAFPTIVDEIDRFGQPWAGFTFYNPKP